MFIIISLIAILLLMSIYFFYRAEHFKKDVNAYRREVKMTKQEHKTILNATLLSASRQEDIFKKRIEQLLKAAESTPSLSATEHEITLLSYLANQYSNVYRELLKGEESIKSLYQKFFGDTGKKYYQEVNDYIRTMESNYRKMWDSKDYCVLMTFIDVLIENQQQRQQKIVNAGVESA